MMVVFQNKIIYMPSVPPFSKSEKLESYVKECSPVRWKQESIKSMDGTSISLAVGECSSKDVLGASPQNLEAQTINKHVVMIYFQGNASSLPPRLPMLSYAIRAVCKGPKPITTTLIAVSYRGFWTSSGRPSQRGIEKDAEAAILWAQQTQLALSDKAGEMPKLVLWGQSIGAGVAAQAVANLSRGDGSDLKAGPRIDALILETPFTSVRNMLVGLYPQRWLPYRYLWPFLRSWWDNERALQVISKQEMLPKLLILDAETDEVVPREHGEQLAQLASALGFDVRQKSVKGVLHHEVMLKGSGKADLAMFLQDVVRK